MKTIDAILLATLKQLQQEVSEGKFPSTGICAYVKRYEPELCCELDSLMMCWPKSTGYNPFPVPASNSDRSHRSATQTYVDSLLNGTLWSGSEHAELRKQLLSWMIEQLEKTQNENS